MNRIRNLNYEKIFENLYLLFFALFLIQQFLYTTMFEIVWPEHLYDDLKGILLVLILVRFAMMRKSNWLDWALVAIVGLGFVISWNHNAYSEIYNCFLLIIGSKGIEFKKICKLFLAIIGGMLLITVIASLTGYVENLIYYRDEKVRMAFGICYPTDFSAYVFFLSAVYCYLRRERIKFIEIGMLICLAVGVYTFCEARLNTICILLLVLGVGYCKIQNGNSVKKGKIYHMSEKLSLFLSVIPTMCAGSMLAATWLYSEDNRFLSFLNNMLSNRLYLGKKGMDLYGISLLGQYIPLQGNGRSTEPAINYFFLDSSYISILLRYGAIVFGIVLLIFCVMNFQAREREDWIFLIVIAVIAMQCMVEHHMMAVYYNPFFFALLAKWKQNNRVEMERQEGIVEEIL